MAPWGSQFIQQSITMEELTTISHTLMCQSDKYIAQLLIMLNHSFYQFNGIIFLDKTEDSK